MTDPTTTAPASNIEAAHELEDMLANLPTPRPQQSVNVILGKGGNYWLHTRTLRMALHALRDRQTRIDAVDTALEAQSGTQLATEQVQRISRLIADLADSEPAPVVTLDLSIMGIQTTALAAVLRAGMASVVGSSSEDSIDYAVHAEPGVALTTFAAHLESFAESRPDRFPYAAVLPAKNAVSWQEGPDDPKPAWISSRALASIIRLASGPVEHDIDGNLIPDSELPDLARRLLKQNEELTREIKAHYERALQGQDTGSTPAPEPSRHYSTAVRQLASDILAVDEEHDLKVRGVVNAVLDAAAEHLRDVLKRPRLTPLVIMSQPKDVSATDVQDLLGRFRGVIADAAADELRILARLDDVRP